MSKNLSMIKTTGGMTLAEIIKEVPVLKEKLNTNASEKLLDKIAKYVGYLTTAELENEEDLSKEDYEIVKMASEKLTEAYCKKRYEEWIQALKGTV